MTARKIPLRTLSALVMLVIVAIACVLLGRWQLHRAAEREALMARIEAGRSATPVVLSADTPTQTLQPWRKAQATGVWRNDLTVLLDNRNHDGRPGYWVATPLQLTSSETSSNANSTAPVLLVLRGWVARPIGPNQALPPLDGPQGTQTIVGEIQTHVPRLFDLGALTGSKSGGLPKDFGKAVNPAAASANAAAEPPSVQNLSLADMETSTGLKYLPVVLQQTASETHGNGTPLVQDWALPQVNADTNRGYAVQWFAFACIAIVAWLVIVWRVWRRPKVQA